MEIKTLIYLIFNYYIVTTTQTVQSLVDAQTGSDFLAADVTKAITAAYTYAIGKGAVASIGAGTVGNADLVISESNSASAIAILAVKMLINNRQIIRSKDESITIQTLDDMWTQEIEDMLLVGDEHDTNQLRFSVEEHTDSWEA